MSLACLVCHGVESPSRSFRSYSVSSSDNEGKCSVMASCFSKNITIPPSRGNASIIPSSKVMPQPTISEGLEGITGTPRLIRSRAVRRDHVRDWNFDVVDLDD